MNLWLVAEASKVDGWIILLPALVLSVLMIATHTYLGLHVLARGVIFIDLALAQVAALGASLAFLLGHDAHGAVALLYAFGAALLASFGCAWLGRIADVTTREVAIGCVYVVASALSILILSRSSVGMEELKTLLNGNILWVRWREVGVIAAVYSLLIAAQIMLRKRGAVLAFGKQATFARELLEQAGVAITPGRDFGAHAAGDHVRFAYANTVERLQEAVQRIGAFLSAER